MTRQEALRVFERVKKRARDVDVVDICDAMIGLLTAAVAKERRQFDRLEYQREYMRRWREKRRRASDGKDEVDGE